MLIWGLFAFTQETANAAPSGNTLIVHVTAQQWQWTFSYDKYNVTTQGAQKLYLPVNVPVKFYVTSVDVLHGFAIRDLGVRVDANPGEVTSTTPVTPTSVTNMAVQCVELCGLYHTFMWEEVDVVSQSQFNDWIVSQGGSV
jgi:cytochrome c oxidase subunit 2